ncbi:SDR family oxidoreductase [Prauserella muralis]|uniref:Uncharacterized protein n=1 Tax=Prauserella muralis TaxID=588067 RepID=A0A2V4B0I2_9PSEU|nr:SDR family oxidoreductase [Prauserella muralis]PXY27704.1 hypothetical protein BAY60_15050 [Prauserella muralis]TWE22550.1 2-deoxy-D-gluconate 3-dehydrogenase [Prauserella muralis]
MISGVLSERTAIITGVGGALAAAAAHALSRAGASVVLASRDAGALDALAAEITAEGGHAVAVPTDLASPVSVRRLVEQTLGAFGHLDAALNNGSAHDIALAMRYQIPSMWRAGGGRIVNVAPDVALQPAVIALTRTAAPDLAMSNVRINAVSAAAHAHAGQVADTIVWLCSDDAALATGETLRVPAP